MQAAVLGFVGSPWTLATYLIEGGSTPLYKKIKSMTASAPDVSYSQEDASHRILSVFTPLQTSSEDRAVQNADIS